MRWLACGMMVVVGACSSAGGDAEQQYGIVRAGGDPAATCKAAKDTAAGYLKDHDQAKYKQWTDTAELECAAARLRSDD